MIQYGLDEQIIAFTQQEALLKAGRSCKELLYCLENHETVYLFNLKHVKQYNNTTIVRMVYTVRTFIIFSSYGIIKHQVFKRHNVNKITGAVMLQSKNILLMK